jgi:3-dehydroquinate synthase
VSVEKVRVELGSRSYDVLVGTGLLEQAGQLVAGVVKRSRLFVVSDRTAWGLHGKRLEKGLLSAGIKLSTIILDPGEATKNLGQLGDVLDRVLDERPERGDMLLAFGGGVIGDLTGVAASLLLRGVDFIQVPTTLLAQVDSSVGGKTGINTRHGKNLVGAFHQPKLVLADLDSLTTLDRREVLAGYAEIVKYGLINDPAFFSWCETNGVALVKGDVTARQRAIVHAVNAKAVIVASDERETGDRALLNLGHTFGHALEAATGFGDALLHGEAVGIGLVLAFDLSARLGLCPKEDAARVRHHLNAVGMPTVPPSGLDAARLVGLMAQDKKVRDGRITFILARGIGKSFVARDVDPVMVRQMLESALAA